MTKIRFKTIFPYLIAFLLVLLFLFLRFYKIRESLFFSNDIGRDFLVFWRWQTSGKPPLLGPQNSALPFNQSAIYFYLLYPFYLIFAGSAYATIIANAIFYLSVFLLGLYLLRNKREWQYSLLIVFFLLTIHPQYIIQTRYIWNPSFVGPAILVAFYAFLALVKNIQERSKLDKATTWLLCFALALAIAFSYSAFTTVLAFLIVALFIFKKKFIPFLLKFITANLVVNLPTLVFELRHNFVLTKMLLYREKLPQPQSNLLDKIANLRSYLFNLPDSYLYLFLVIFIILLFQYFRNNKEKTFSALNLSLILLILSIILTFIAPFAIQAHYIFGILTLFFIVLSFFCLENHLVLVLLLMLSIFWLNPQQVQKYFTQAPSTVDQVQACAKDFCQEHTQTMFVAIQSGLHPYHNGTEWQYLLPKFGCSLKDLVTESNEAEYLAMIVEYSQYEHNKTAFNELTIFGPSEELETFTCHDNLEIKVLKKIKD